MALSVTALVFVGIWVGSQSDDFGPAFSLEDQAGDPLRRGIEAWVDDLQTLIGSLQEGAQLMREGAPKVPGNWDRLVTDRTTQPSGARPA